MSPSLNVLIMGGRTTGFHQFEIMGPIYRDFLTAAGIAVTLTENRDDFLADRLKPYDVILDYTTGEELTPEQGSGLLGSINGGKGFVGIHSAADSFKNTPGYLAMVGGKFLTHPAQMPHDFAIRQPAHPIMAGVRDFTMVEELYLMETYGPFEVLLTTRFEGFERPAAWVKPYGRGRVFYLALGHGEEQTRNPNFQKLVINGLHWANNPYFKTT